MLEILALIYLCRKMGELAERKGQKKGTWKLYTVLAWFGAEFFGVFLSIFFTNEIGFTLLIGYGLAIASYFLLKSILSGKPDAVPSTFEFEQTH